MKLIGSRMEEEFRNELIRSYNSLFHNVEERRLRKILRKYFPESKTAFVLDWTPEQGEDLYWILINTEFIAGLEVDRFDLDVEPIVEKTSINEYKKGLSKSRQIKLAVALDLAKKELEKLMEP